MKWTVWILAVVVLLGVVSAQAGTVVLTFEGLQCEEAVGNYYNGGTGGNGSGPGTNYGIGFSDNALALQDTPHCPQYGSNIGNLPSPYTGLFFLGGSAATMNVAAGFDTGFSFYYAAPNHTGFIDVYSGLDGTGTNLAHLDLSMTAGCNSTPMYCVWDPIGVAFSGTAMSVNFGGTANYIVFDNITLGADVPVNTTPEPATFALLGGGLLGLMGLRRRK